RTRFVVARRYVKLETTRAIRSRNLFREKLAACHHRFGDNCRCRRRIFCHHSFTTMTVASPSTTVSPFWFLHVVERRTRFFESSSITSRVVVIVSFSLTGAVNLSVCPR